MLSGFISYTGIFCVLRSFYLHDNSLVNPDHLDTEFWNREDEAIISAEDISDSDDRNEVVSKIAISNISTKAGLDAKFKALERAENAYYQAKGQTKQQGGSIVDKKSISQALRDACMKRLLDALGQAKLRLGNLPCNAEASATHLETECFKTYEKVGKTFYNSQIVATVWWLSSTTSNQMRDRLRALIDQTTDHGAPSSPCFVPELPPDEAIRKGSRKASNDEAKDKPQPVRIDGLEKRKHSHESAKTEASAENMELPLIPSFREFLNLKRRDGTMTSSSSIAESHLSGIRRKSSGVTQKQETIKKMKP